MTVASEINHNQYVGNGVTTSFDYGFRIFKNSHLLVQVIDLDGVITTLVLGTDYTVTGVGASGGKVVLTTPLATGWAISIDRNLPIVQETDLRNQGTFYAETHEDAFDYLTMLIQRVYSYFNLALRKPSWLAKFYDALGNRISNLEDPTLPQDAVTKNYADGVAQTNLNRTLRVPDMFIDTMPSISQLEGKVIAIVNGKPVGLVPQSGSATDVMIQLAKNTGAALIGSESGVNIQDYLRAIDINTTVGLISSKLPPQIKVVRTSGYYDVFGESDVWVRSSDTGPASQTPLQLNKIAVSDANGSIWYLDISDGVISIDSLGAKGTGLSTDDDWYFLELALKNGEQGTNRVVKGNRSAYYFSKPILMKTGRHLEFNCKFGLDITYGGQLLSTADAPDAGTPAGVGFVSKFSDKQAQIVVAHTAGKYASYWSVKNCYIKNAGGVTSSYGIYCPFANNFELESVWSVGGMIGIDSRNIYAYSFLACYFAPPNGIMGTVGINVTPIQNGLGSGTSGTFVRVGVTNYKYSWFMNEMNYTTATSCYSEGSLTRYAFSLSRCNGVNFNTYGIENLTAVSGDGRLAAVVDSQVSFNGLQASFNINLTGTSAAFTVSGSSQVTINDMFIAAVGSPYIPLLTDSTSRVRMYGFKSTGPTPLGNSVGSQTVVWADQGRTECVTYPGNWNGGFIRIGSVRLWDDGSGLRIKRTGDPGSITDGSPL